MYSQAPASAEYERKQKIFMLDMSEKDIFVLAKSFTELAIQNNMISANEDSSKTAESVVQFFNTLVEKLSE